MLRQAIAYTSNERQQFYLTQLNESLKTGDLDEYRAAQHTWIKDENPRSESIFGFVEPYRDPYGTRAEFEALVAINDPEETDTLVNL